MTQARPIQVPTRDTAATLAGSGVLPARRLQATLVGSGLGLTVIAVTVRDPHTLGAWGTCPVLTVTGHFCPGCGALRAMHDIAAGHFGEAAGHNALTALLLPMIIAWVVMQFLPATARHRPWKRVAAAKVRLSVNGPLLVLILVVVFTVARNFSGSPLAP